MNGGFKTLLYILGGFLVFYLIMSLTFTILPWAILIGLILYIFFKIKGWFIQRRNNKNSNQYYNNETSNYDAKVDTIETEDIVGNVIDVDYEDVDNK